MFCITVSISKLRNSTSYPLHCIVLLSQDPDIQSVSGRQPNGPGQFMFGAVKTQSDNSVFPIDYRALNREEEYILISHTDISVMMDVTINGF